MLLLQFPELKQASGLLPVPSRGRSRLWGHDSCDQLVAQEISRRMPTMNEMRVSCSRTRS